MTPSDILRTSVFALRGNWMRSTLTSLGVIIGIAAVIVMVAIGQGAKSQIQARVNSLGTNLVVITPGATQAGGVT